MFELNIDNLKFDNHCLSIYRNSVLKVKIKYSDLKKVSLVKKRRKGWLVEIILSIIIIILAIIILKHVLHFSLSNIIGIESFRSIQISSIGIATFIMFSLLGFHGLKSFKRGYFFIINDKYEVCVSNKEIEKIEPIRKFFEFKGVLS